MRLGVNTIVNVNVLILTGMNTSAERKRKRTSLDHKITHY